MSFLSGGYWRERERWAVSTLMHLCAQTDDTPPDLSAHLPPQSRFTALFSTALFARGALFSSVLNELNGRTAKGTTHSKHKIQQHSHIAVLTESRDAICYTVQALLTSS